jgi:N-acetyl-gamma-glutamyl-phosphate reductase
MDFYKNSRFIRVLPEGEFPNIKDVAGTNFCDIGLKLDAQSGRLVIVSVIDNLVKGASGQAIQNMNIMFGLDETLGLLIPPRAV